MVGDRRLGVVPFLGIWVVITGAQAAVVAGPFGLPLPAMIGIVAVLQLIKAAPTSMRLNDIGRQPSEGLFLALIPLVNAYGFFSFCLKGTPSDALRDRRRAKWAGLMDWPEAFGGGLKLSLRTAAIGLPVCVVYAVVGSLGGQYALRGMEWCGANPPETVVMWSQVLWSIAGFLAAYTVIQYRKRATASRASWFPSLALLPIIMVAGALMLHAKGMREMGPIMMMLFMQAWYLWWTSVGGAAAAVAWVVAGEGARKGEPPTTGVVIGEVAAKTLDVAAAHGGAKHAVTIGMQVLIPGIFYAIQYGFVDMVAVLDPDRASLRRSSDLTWGHRARLFKLLFVWFVVLNGLIYGIGFALEPWEDMSAAMFDPRVIDLPTVVLQDFAWAVCTWVLTMALLLMYTERVEREAVKRAERAAQKNAAEAEPEPAPAI